MLYIAVRNSVSAPVLADNPALATTKGSSAHGLGLLSVRRVAERHNGSADFHDGNGFFTAEVWLFTN